MPMVLIEKIFTLRNETKQQQKINQTQTEKVKKTDKKIYRGKEGQQQKTKTQNRETIVAKK